MFFLRGKHTRIHNYIHMCVYIYIHRYIYIYTLSCIAVLSWYFIVMKKRSPQHHLSWARRPSRSSRLGLSNDTLALRPVFRVELFGVRKLETMDCQISKATNRYQFSHVTNHAKRGVGKQLSTIKKHSNIMDGLSLLCYHESGWWFGTCSTFHRIGNME